MLNSLSILSFLDQAFERIDMPCLGNMNIDYIANRLSLYRSPDKWLMLFNSIVWWPAAEGLMTTVEVVGSGVIGKQGFDNDRLFAPGEIKLDYQQVEGPEQLLALQVREQEVPVASLKIQPNYELQVEYGFWAAVALAEHYKEQLFASEAEIARFIPAGFQHLLTLDQWDHPNWNRPASQTESFPRLAEILATGDPGLWKPVADPNTHWSHWLPK